MREVNTGTLTHQLWGGSLRSGWGLAFDGDGTLWQGDVSDDVFLDGVDRGLLRGEALPALTQLAGAHGLPPSGSASSTAAALFRSHRLGGISERATYAMMAWCWAGWGEEELTNHARIVLRHKGLLCRARADVVHFFAEAQRRGHYVAVISASPRPILCAALELLDLAPDALIATRAERDRGLQRGQLEGVVPYGGDKARAALALTPGRRWLAAFGDSLFDRELLELAEVPVVVGAKPPLAQALTGHPRAVRLLGQADAAGGAPGLP